MEENIENGYMNEDENAHNTKAEKFASDDTQDHNVGKDETEPIKKDLSKSISSRHNIVKDETEPIKKDLSKSATSLGSQIEPREVVNKDQQETVEERENKKDEEGTAADELENFKYTEEPPPDPAAPYNLTDSSEALKPPFELRPDQMAELEDLWDLYQDYTPAYTDINAYITEKELVYMLKSLFLMPNTPEQLQELIAFCVRPPHPEGHIEFNQFVKIATIRYRDISIEDNLRSALQALEQGEGLINRENMREILTTMGNKMPVKQANLLIKEVDIRNDGLIGIEDVMATICIDLIFD